MAYEPNKKTRTKDLKSLATKTKSLNDNILNLIGALSSLTTTDKSSIIKAINELVSTDKSLDSRTGVLRDGLASAAGTARGGFHNSIFRGCSLGSALTAEQSATIQAGKFDDIWLGDHWDFSNVAYTYKDVNGATQSATWSGTMRVAGCDYAWNCNGVVTKHHVAVIPDGSLFTAKMNESADGVTGGYAASQMHTVHMQRALAIFEACFGADHIVPYLACYSNAVDSNGAVTGLVKSSSAKVELMNEAQHYGSRMMSCPKEYWTNEMVRQFPLFRVRPDLAGTRSGVCWLNGIADPSIPGIWVKAWCMDYCGHPVTWECTYEGRGGGVRPFALVC